MCRVHPAISQPFTIHQPQGVMHLNGCAKASAIFLAVIAGVLSCGLLAVPVFFLSAALFRHAAVNSYREHPFAFRQHYVIGRTTPIIVPDRTYFAAAHGRPACAAATGRRGVPARNPWIRG